MPYLGPRSKRHFSIDNRKQPCYKPDRRGLQTSITGLVGARCDWASAADVSPMLGLEFQRNVLITTASGFDSHSDRIADEERAELANYNRTVDAGGSHVDDGEASPDA